MRTKTPIFVAGPNPTHGLTQPMSISYLALLHLYRAFHYPIGPFSPPCRPLQLGSSVTACASCARSNLMIKRTISKTVENTAE